LRLIAPVYEHKEKRQTGFLPEPACHETTYCSGFQSFGFLVYAVPLCGRFFGFDDDLRLAGHHLRRVLEDDAAR
jgi:hypothetical protein